MHKIKLCLQFKKHLKTMKRKLHSNAASDTALALSSIIKCFKNTTKYYNSLFV